MMDGWIKSYRKMFDNPIVCKDAEYLAVWVYLLHFAAHEDHDFLFNKQRITIHQGQVLTSRKTIAEKLHISESKVQRILKSFEIEQQIEQQTDRQKRLITVLNWDKYQKSEQPFEQRVNNDRTTSEQRVNTYKNDKNIENDKNVRSKEKDIPKGISKKKPSQIIPPTLEMVKEYCESRGNGIDPGEFIDFYTSKGWFVGKDKMKDWQASIRTWERKRKEKMLKESKPQTVDRSSW